MSDSLTPIPTQESARNCGKLVELPDESSELQKQL